MNGQCFLDEYFGGSNYLSRSKTKRDRTKHADLSEENFYLI